MSSSVISVSVSGLSVIMKWLNDMLFNCYRNRFWGLLSGVVMDLVLMVSVMMIMSCWNGSGVSVCSDIINGMMMNSVMLLVSYIDSMVVKLISSIVSFCLECM